MSSSSFSLVTATSEASERDSLSSDDDGRFWVDVTIVPTASAAACVMDFVMIAVSYCLCCGK